MKIKNVNHVLYIYGQMRTNSIGKFFYVWIFVGLACITSCDFGNEQDDRNLFIPKKIQGYVSIEVDSLMHTEPWTNWESSNFRPMGAGQGQQTWFEPDTLLLSWMEFPTEYLAFGFFMHHNPFPYHSSLAYPLRDKLVVYRGNQVGVIRRSSGIYWNGELALKLLTSFGVSPDIPSGFGNLPLAGRITGSESVIIRPPLAGISWGDWIVARYPCFFQEGLLFRSISTLSPAEKQKLRSSLSLPKSNKAVSSNENEVLFGRDSWGDPYLIVLMRDEVAGMWGCSDSAKAREWVDKALSIPFEVEWLNLQH